MKLEEVFEGNVTRIPERINQLVYTVMVAHEEGIVTDRGIHKYLNRFESLGYDVTYYRRYLEQNGE